MIFLSRYAKMAREKSPTACYAIQCNIFCFDINFFSVLSQWTPHKSSKMKWNEMSKLFLIPEFSCKFRNYKFDVFIVAVIRFINGSFFPLIGSQLNKIALGSLNFLNEKLNQSNICMCQAQKHDANSCSKHLSKICCMLNNNLFSCNVKIKPTSLSTKERTEPSRARERVQRNCLQHNKPSIKFPFEN